jgi:hypothetical protein
MIDVLLEILQRLVQTMHCYPSLMELVADMNGVKLTFTILLKVLDVFH